jgi:hypothetical protein
MAAITLPASPPVQVAEAEALACQLPAETGAPPTTRLRAATRSRGW